MSYTEHVTLSITTGATITSQLVGASAPLVKGDALVIDGVWCEVAGQTGVNAELRVAYTGLSQTSASALLIRFASSSAPPSLRLRAEYHHDKLRQKLGEELIHFLTN